LKDESKQVRRIERFGN